MPDQEPQGQGGASELASFGEELRREREIRGISLKEIADATKISKRFLEAIERNDHRTLPAPAFTRGFVRAYARYVGLNSEEMVNRYNFAVASDDRIEKPPHIEKYPQTPIRDISPKPPAKRGIPPVYARINRNIIWSVLIMLALGGVAYWAIQYRGQAEAEPDPAAVPVATKAIVPPPLPPPENPTDDSKLRLAMEVVAPSWVRLEADGKTVVNTRMEPGERRTFEATDVFNFHTIGNAAGIRLTLNGVTVPPLGEDGEVVKNRVFDRDALQKIRAEAPAQTRS
ncbi:MAG: cytoskeleton protein RodZ [Acidobacteriota bacterium]|jgi:transcriptional regulator with XRE-family HTH domain|nr:cytoskeleton protein RodZ [Acidobacteriota bacterium]